MQLLYRRITISIVTTHIHRERVRERSACFNWLSVNMGSNEWSVYIEADSMTVDTVSKHCSTKLLR